MSDLDLIGARTVLAWATSDRLDEIASHACGASAAAETAFAALRVALAEVDRLTRKAKAFDTIARSFRLDSSEANAARLEAIDRGEA